MSGTDGQADEESGARPSRAGPVDASDLLHRVSPRDELPEGTPVVTGIPLPGEGDAASACDGPEAIREALRTYTSYRGAGGEDLRGVAPLHDMGDVPFRDDDAGREGQKIFRAARHLFQRGIRPLFLGGAHVLLEPVLQGLARSERLEEPALVVLDAHLDLREREDAHTLSRGTPFTAAIRSGFLDPRRIVVAGLRPFATSRMLTEWIRESGVELLMVDDLGRENLVEPLHAAVSRITEGADGLFLSVDLDVLDAAHGPGTMDPSPGGLSSRELLVAIRAVVGCGTRLAGADVSGLLPDRDGDSASTAKTGALALLEIAAGLARERGEASGGAVEVRQEPGETGEPDAPAGGSSRVH